MGMARLLAKGWVVFCLFAGAHALRLAMAGGSGEELATICVCTLLFVAMGLLFVGGYAAATGHVLFEKLTWSRVLPGFDALVFAWFVTLSFANQAFFASGLMDNRLAQAVRGAIAFAVPGQRAFESALDCGLDGGRVFASSFAWLLAIVYVASSASRLRLSAGLIRLERNERPEVLGAVPLAFLLGVAAVIGIQFLFLGTAYLWMPCEDYASLPGEILIGLAPLMLAYLIVAALANLLAAGPE